LELSGDLREIVVDIWVLVMMSIASNRVAREGRTMVALSDLPDLY
jgi:hypothetical protein